MPIPSLSTSLTPLDPCLANAFGTYKPIITEETLLTRSIPLVSLAVCPHLMLDVITDLLCLCLMKLRWDQRGLVRPATPAIWGVDLDELGRGNVNGLLKVCPYLGVQGVSIILASPLMVL